MARAARRAGPLRRVTGKWLKYTDPHSTTQHLVQIDGLSYIYYNEVLACGHDLDLPILTMDGRWGDNAGSRRCDQCQKAEDAYEAAINAALE